MAEQMITSALKDVVQELRVQNLVKHVRQFHGEGTTKFSNWLKDMDLLSASCDSARMRVLATLTLGGTAGTHVARIIREEPQIGWSGLREKLRARYSDLTDPFLAQEKCRRMRQHKSESVQNFAERLLSAANEAFTDLQSANVQSMLVDIFQKGVTSDHLARHLIRKRFQTLDAALEFAEDEQKADRTFEMYRHAQPSTEEPMEVDVVRDNEGREIEKLQKSLQNLNKKIDTMSRQMKTRPSQPKTNSSRTSVEQNPAPARGVPARADVSRPPPGYGRETVPGSTPVLTYRWTDNGRPICHKCGKVGHIGRRCRQFSSGNATASLGH